MRADDGVMREDHLIDAPPDYVHRLRAGATTLAIAGYAAAACAVASMLALPASNTMPIARTGLVSTLVLAWVIALAIWCKGWWRLTEAPVEALPSRATVIAGTLVRTALVLGVVFVSIWAVGVVVRSIGVGSDRHFAETLALAGMPIARWGSVALIAVVFVAGQCVIASLAARTAPTKPNLHLFPLTLAMLPTGLAVWPAAMNRFTLTALVVTLVTLAFAYTGAQGAVLRWRLGRLLRERRRAEVLVTREA